MLFTIVSTMLFNEQSCSLLFQQCCSTNNVVHYCFNNVVERTMFTIVSTMLFTVVSTMLFNEQCCSLLFQQCCSALMKQQRLFTVVETGENNIDKTSLFIIVITVAQPC